MSLEINEIEKRLQSLIEVHLVKYLPNQVTQDRVAQRISEALRSNLSTQGLEHQNSATTYELVVHPSVLSQWQKDPRLLEGLNKIFRLVIGEAGIKFDEVPNIDLATDPLVPIDDVRVRLNKTAEVAETQEMNENKDIESAPAKSAFLIVGGTKVYTIQQAVTNIGRRLDNHLVVDDPRVSRYHAQIRHVRGRFIIFDLNSTGGTYVNGQRINNSVLYPGDVISLAGLPVIFGQDNPPSSTSPGDTSPLTSTSGERETATLRTIPPQEKKQ